MNLTISEIDRILKALKEKSEINQNLVSKLESYRYRLTRP